MIWTKIEDREEGEEGECETEIGVRESKDWVRYQVIVAKQCSDEEFSGYAVLKYPFNLAPYYISDRNGYQGKIVMGTGIACACGFPDFCKYQTVQEAQQVAEQDYSICLLNGIASTNKDETPDDK